MNYFTTTATALMFLGGAFASTQANATAAAAQSQVCSFTPLVERLSGHLVGGSINPGYKPDTTFEEIYDHFSKKRRRADLVKRYNIEGIGRVLTVQRVYLTFPLVKRRRRSIRSSLNTENYPYLIRVNGKVYFDNKQDGINGNEHKKGEEGCVER